MEPIVRMDGIVKRFGGTIAVDAVDFEVRAGEIHALLGGNGAGKSTLIKILAGVHLPDAGTIRFEGRIAAPHLARLPAAFIHQDLALVEWMTVAENIALGAGYPRRAGLIAWPAVARQAREALQIIGCDIDPATRVSALSRTDRSIIAIARALSGHAALVVLDEPTASLPEAEVARLFEVLKHLKRQGTGMIYVSHRLDEIFRLADRVTVMRDGRRVATRTIAETTPDELVELIVGRAALPIGRNAAPRGQAPVLEIEDLTADGAGPVDLSVYPGEIVGLAGLRGAGQDTIGRAICGIVPSRHGAIRLLGAPLDPRSPADTVRRGIAFISSKRHEESLALALAVRENLFANPAANGRAAHSALGREREAEAAGAVLRKFDVRPPTTENAIHTLSGGNQQKVVLARWLGSRRKLLVLEEPTMGVDVGAKAEIYALLNSQLGHGGAVIIVSTDLEEIAAVCSRVLIFSRGRIVAECPRAALSAERLIALVGGLGDASGESRP